MKAASLFAIAMLLAAPSPGQAKKPPAGRWQVTRTTDPITGRSTCIVAAMDMAGGLSFSRVGALYPFLESNSELGSSVSAAGVAIACPPAISSGGLMIVRFGH